MHHSLAIGRTPRETWQAQLDRLPTACPCPARCDAPRSCRERNAEYLRVQWRVVGKREQAARDRAARKPA